MKSYEELQCHEKSKCDGLTFCPPVVPMYLERGTDGQGREEHDHEEPRTSVENHINLYYFYQNCIEYENKLHLDLLQKQIGLYNTIKIYPMLGARLPIGEKKYVRNRQRTDVCPRRAGLP